MAQQLAFLVFFALDCKLSQFVECDLSEEILFTTVLLLEVSNAQVWCPVLDLVLIHDFSPFLERIGVILTHF